MAEKKRLPKDFNQNKVDDIEITDPDRAAREAAGIPVDRDYPKHLHKFVDHAHPHEYIEVLDAKDEAVKRRDGWMSPQEAAAVGRAQADQAASGASTSTKAPRAKKPAAAKTPPKKAAPKKAAK